MIGVFAVFFGIVILVGIFGHLGAKKRREELRAWAQSRGLHFSEHRDDSHEDDYPDFSAFRRGRSRHAFNRCRGTIDDRDVCAFDYHYTTTSRDSKGNTSTQHHYFSGVLVRAQIPLEPLVVRPEHFFDKMASFFGKDDIDFESAEFSRQFHVSSPDRKWAYDVLHQRAIEFLLDHPVFTIEFGHRHVLVMRKSRFDAPTFDHALDIAIGLLDRLPEYVRRQRQERSESP